MSQGFEFRRSDPVECAAKVTGCLAWQEKGSNEGIVPLWIPEDTEGTEEYVADATVEADEQTLEQVRAEGHVPVPDSHSC